MDGMEVAPDPVQVWRVPVRLPYYCWLATTHETGRTRAPPSRLRRLWPNRWLLHREFRSHTDCPSARPDDHGCVRLHCLLKALQEPLPIDWLLEATDMQVADFK